MKSVFSALIAFAAVVALGALLNVKRSNINMGEKQTIRGLRHHHSMDFEMEGRPAGLYAGRNYELEGRPETGMRKRGGTKYARHEDCVDAMEQAANVIIHIMNGDTIPRFLRTTKLPSGTKWEAIHANADSLNQFVDFCRTEYSYENPRFVLDFYRLKERFVNFHTDPIVTTLIKNIIPKYIQNPEGATPREINIPSKTKALVLANCV